MNIHYLKFANKAEAVAVIAANEPELFWLDNDIPHIRGSHDFAIDLVGDVYHATGLMLQDSEGNDYPEMILVDGYHVNLNLVKSELPEYLKTFTVFPITPARVWS